MNKGSVRDAFRKRQCLKQSQTNKRIFGILVCLSQVNEHPGCS